MSTGYPIPQALFDTLENLSQHTDSIYTYLKTLCIASTEQEFQLCLRFLTNYRQSTETFTAYRREIERFLHWAWLVCKKPLKGITDNEIREYLAFVNNPPRTWIAIKNVDRYIADSTGLRRPNPEWRPFVARISKVQRRLGIQPDKSNYQLGSKSIAAIVAALSSLFSFLKQEKYLESNPVSLIRPPKSTNLKQPTRMPARQLSSVQWPIVISAAKALAQEDPQHERTLFLMSAFHLLGVRISELAYTSERIVTMDSFAKDKNGVWWFTTNGKGKKVRDINVPDELLMALQRYRLVMGLPALPERGETRPLLTKLKGQKGLGSRQIRNLVQAVFDRAINTLLQLGKNGEAEALAIATVHWLRPTSQPSNASSNQSFATDKSAPHPTKKT